MCNALDNPVIAFAAARGEKYFSGFAAQRSGYFAARRFYSGAAGLCHRIDTRGVAVMLLKIRQHLV